MNDATNTQADRMADEASSIYDGQGYDREYPEEVKVTSGDSAVVRLLDGSNSFLKYSISWFMCDDEVIRPFIVENDIEGKGVLARMLGDQSNFYRGGILESKKGQFGKVEVHKPKDPELYDRLTKYWNPSYSGNGSCRPKKEYIYNAIHRNLQEIDGAQANWCQVNKHTKIMRLGPTMFKNLKTVRDNEGEFDGYDVLFSKEGKGTDTTHIVMKAGLKTEPKVVGDLTEEEKKYERYDLEEVIRLSSATYILKFLKSTIERIDSILGTSYLTELEAQKNIEQEEFKKNQEAAGETVPEIPKEARVDTGETPPQPQTSAEPPPVPPATPAQAPTAVGPQAPSQAQPQSAPQPQAPPQRVPVTETSTTCGHCGMAVVDGTVVCPSCKGTLKAPCDVCQNMFSVFDSVCPHCNTKYQTPSA